MESNTIRVLSIDMSTEVVDFFRKENLETYDGTCGAFIDARNVDYHWDKLPIYLDSNLPDNLQEYSVVQDLNAERKTIPYDIKQNNKQRPIVDSGNHILCLF